MVINLDNCKVIWAEKIEQSVQKESHKAVLAIYVI